MTDNISRDELNNTVSSKDQLKESQYVTFENISGNNDGIKIMFVGNSITRHAPKPDIGWFGDFGMAASAKEKDYVHIVISEVLNKHPNAKFCITQGAEWERDMMGCDLEKHYSASRDFAPDIIIYRLGENIPNEGLTEKVYCDGIERLISFLTSENPDAQIIYCTDFWFNKLKDETVVAYAQSKGKKAVFLGDLGDKDENKAIGLFEHPGVAAHPGDLGMKRIAERIIATIDEILH